MPSVDTWYETLHLQLFNGYPREWLINTGRIPFADWSDWGLLCFDTFAICENQKYPVVLWNHQEPEKFTQVYGNFENMLIQLDRAETAE